MPHHLEYWGDILAIFICIIQVVSLFFFYFPCGADTYNIKSCSCSQYIQNFNE